ncbi:hypothetical protein EV421DRAFT_1908485 [Armillaria borealis]|uniref:Uncharacterized protein n=1 Tax=Armillaria borealis TaxID=47425 RepID=A0AA39MII8_9AGAR|nr:hypothetical protein EV421DRAFT_1908485 [Armillaria borealis]
MIASSLSSHPADPFGIYVFMRRIEEHLESIEDNTEVNESKIDDMDSRFDDIDSKLEDIDMDVLMGGIDDAIRETLDESLYFKRMAAMVYYPY